MKEILVINLTRMGDLIQTTPAIMALKERYPEARITLLVSSHFVEICKLIPLVDRYIDIDEIYIARAAKYNDLLEGYRYFKKVMEQVNDRTYDLVVNYTNSSSSAIITSLIRAKERRGICIDERGFILRLHPWIRYIFNLIPSRSVNPFHLCDLHVKSSGGELQNKGLHLVVNEELLSWANDFLNKQGIKDNDLIVALQLGASVDEKRWPVKAFARLADRLSDELGATILLTGTKSETQLSEEFLESSHAKTLNLVGRTNLSELSALMKRADLLVSNDTGTLHVATAVGTRVINISLASVHFRETGPYGEGHFVITPTVPCYPCHFESGCIDQRCKENIHPEAVFQLCKAVLLDSLDVMNTEYFDDIQIYYSMFDVDGMLCYLPLIKRKPGTDDFFTYLYKYTWPQVLDRKQTLTEDEILGLVEKKLSLYDENPELYDTLSQYSGDFEKLIGMIDAMLSVMSVMKRYVEGDNLDINFLEKLWENIEPIDRQIESLAHVAPYIKPIYVILKYEKEAFRGQNLKEIIDDAITAYRYARWQAEIMSKVIRRYVSKRNFSLT